jgi:hypothetical protein
MDLERTQKRRRRRKRKRRTRRVKRARNQGVERGLGVIVVAQRVKQTQEATGKSLTGNNSLEITQEMMIVNLGDRTLETWLPAIGRQGIILAKGDETALAIGDKKALETWHGTALA